MNTFIKIQEGMYLFLRYELRQKGILENEDVIKNTFRHLISEEQIPEKIDSSCKEMIEILKSNDSIVTIFLKAMRIKTMMMSKIGLMEEGLTLRLHLLSLELSIAEDSSELPTPDEFFKEAGKFCSDCHKKYE